MGKRKSKVKVKGLSILEIWAFEPQHDNFGIFHNSELCWGGIE